MGLSQQFQVLEVLEVLPLFLGAKVTEGWRAHRGSAHRGSPCVLKESIVAQQTFLEYAKDRAKERKRKVRAGTWEYYELFFRFMESWNVIVRFTDVTEKNIAKMDKLLEKRGLKECSRWNYHKIMQTFIGEAVNDGLLTRNPYTTLNISRGRDDVPYFSGSFCSRLPALQP